MRWPGTSGFPFGPPLLSAGLLVLAQPPFHIPFLSFLALVPLAVTLGRLPSDSSGVAPPGGRSVPAEAPPRAGGGLEAARIGLVFGTAHWALVLLWIPLFVAPRFTWAWPGLGALLGILGGLSALLGWGVHRLHARARLPLSVAFPLVWVAVEWIKGHFPFGLAWPWMGLGVSLSRWPELLGIAEWVGEPGVSLWLAAVNGLVASALLAAAGPEPGGRRVPGLAALALALTVLPALAGILRARSLAEELEPGPSVAVVGTLVPRALRSDPPASAREALRQVESALAHLPRGAADLVILPEGTVPFPLESEAGAAAGERLSRMSAAVGAPLLVGVLESAAELEGAEREATVEGPATNSAILLTEAGAVAYRYDKVRLVPGMEWGGFQAGASPVPARHGEMAVGPMICYESLFAGLARAQRRAGADLLANLTSDVWFGDAGSLPGWLFLEQHPAHLVLRAVENRVAVARAANGGISLFLDPLGRRVGEAVPPRGGLARASLSRWPGRTLHSRTGDLVGPVALLLTLLLAFLPGRCRREGGAA